MANKTFDSLNDITSLKTTRNFKVRVVQFFILLFNPFYDINSIDMVLVNLSVNFTIFNFNINIIYHIYIFNIFIDLIYIF